MEPNQAAAAAWFAHGHHGLVAAGERRAPRCGLDEGIEARLNRVLPVSSALPTLVHPREITVHITIPFPGRRALTAVLVAAASVLLPLQASAIKLFIVPIELPPIHPPPAAPKLPKIPPILKHVPGVDPWAKSEVPHGDVLQSKITPFDLKVPVPRTTGSPSASASVGPTRARLADVVRASGGLYDALHVSVSEDPVSTGLYRVERNGIVSYFDDIRDLQVALIGAGEAAPQQRLYVFVDGPRAAQDTHNLQLALANLSSGVEIAVVNATEIIATSFDGANSLTALDLAAGPAGASVLSSTDSTIPRDGGHVRFANLVTWGRTVVITVWAKTPELLVRFIDTLRGLYASASPTDDRSHFAFAQQAKQDVATQLHLTAKEANELFAVNIRSSQVVEHRDDGRMSSMQLAKAR